jgi:hypothetical protein
MRYGCAVDLRLVAAIAALGIAGCASTTSPGRGEARVANLAKAQILDAFDRPCSPEARPSFTLPPDAPEPPAAPPPQGGPFTPSVFLDTALFLLPTARADVRLPASSHGLAHDPDVLLLGTPHLSAELDATSRVAVEDHTGPLLQPVLHELSATAKPTEDAGLAIALEAVLQLPTSPNATGKPPESRIHWLTAPKFGQPVVLTAQVPERPGQSLLLLLTPYSIRGEADLRAIFLCKMAQRQAAASFGD